MTVKAGRPRKIKSPAEFEFLAQQYFDLCDKSVPKEPYLITGLALGLGLSSRQELYDYAGYEGFEDVVAVARMRVERGYERRMHEGKPVGAIFALKNMGWRDERHIDHKSSDGSMSSNKVVTLDVSKLDSSQLAALWGAMVVTDKTPENETTVH